jgi:hypothetical protein
MPKTVPQYIKKNFPRVKTGPHPENFSPFGGRSTHHKKKISGVEKILPPTLFTSLIVLTSINVKSKSSTNSFFPGLGGFITIISLYISVTPMVMLPLL